MQCPVDGETLVMADRSGVEIDYCPKCRGVWLDRGELDKILERAAAPVPPAPPAASREPVYQREPQQARDHRGDDRRDDRRDDRDRDGYRRYDDDDDRRYGKKRRRESFLSDIFDF